MRLRPWIMQLDHMVTATSYWGQCRRGRKRQATEREFCLFAILTASLNQNPIRYFACSNLDHSRSFFPVLPKNFIKLLAHFAMLI